MTDFSGIRVVAATLFAEKRADRGLGRCSLPQEGTV